jgi:predicted N-formylglutamate amidohydrolase
MTYILITCEHASNQIPKKYTHLFTGMKQILNSHRGWDIGALFLTKKISTALKVPYFPGLTSRLVVELNRSLTNPSLFSSFTKILSQAEKKELLEVHYFPFRTGIEKEIRDKIEKKAPVIHIAIHSFTPKLNGIARETDIGVLYDPKRPREKHWARQFKASFANSPLRVRLNYPYRGTSDGFPTYLRDKFPLNDYIGIELEVNQAWLDKKKELFVKLHLKQLIEAIKKGSD